ncbi:MULTISPECIES: site-specific integrase [Veillonella]|uniref:tyrosine-type recombinase/integrase n=2 Tax=Veillonellaceae TaxID=31977 RepID=UPI00257B2238|nr:MULTISPECIES: site-specific integrase [Veillonella]MBS5067341.1 site-specific integrase [Veillonella sp.]MDU1161404.1 tyrosine-type recombinase/integrase [Veillonella parvula]MDU1166792.1 tyrosine-type recombinase/integrase [Veillonella parvula]MDU1260384.1 tyrosine-type recombinase/integrase [Veillonella sp.]
MAKKRSDGRYQVSKVINGKRKYFYGSTRKAATEAMEKYVNANQSCANFDDTISLNTWINIWLNLKEKTITPATYQSYTGIINRYIRDKIGGVKLAEIKPNTLRYVFESMDGLSSRTISYTMTILGSILEQAVKDDIIPKNYMKNIDRPKQVKVRHMVTLSADEVKDFLSNISNTEHHALFKLAFATGMRRSELLGLRWSDIDFKKSTISISQTALKIGSTAVISNTTKTTSSKRIIAIDTETLHELMKHKTVIDKRRIKTMNWINNNLVFPGIKGAPRCPDEVSKLCKKYANLIGKPTFTMHGTRHTHATLLIENGANMKAIQERLGHASFQETMDTYSHVTPKMEDDIVERIAKIF